MVCPRLVQEPFRDVAIGSAQVVVAAHVEPGLADQVRRHRELDRVCRNVRFGKRLRHVLQMCKFSGATRAERRRPRFRIHPQAHGRGYADRIGPSGVLESEACRHAGVDDKLAARRGHRYGRGAGGKAPPGGLRASKHTAFPELFVDQQHR
jgi:hypothetical protein